MNGELTGVGASSAEPASALQEAAGALQAAGDGSRKVVSSRLRRRLWALRVVSELLPQPVNVRLVKDESTKATLVIIDLLHSVFH